MSTFHSMSRLCNTPACLTCRMGLQKEAKLVIGIPMLTSARSLRFWLQLCSANGQGGAAELLQTFADCEARGPEYMQTFCSDFMAHLISKVHIYWHHAAGA